MKSHSKQPIIPLYASTPHSPPALDLLRMPLIGRFLHWRHARTAMQIPVLLVAALMVWDGFTGSQLAPRNLATTMTWVHYRGVLVLALLAAGNLFCMACPFMLPRNLARRLFAPVRMWPKRLRNKWVAVALLALFLFSYELFDLWATPWWTAWLIVGYFGAALLVDSVFKGAAFCKYVCPIGQFNFVSSLISPLEVAVRSPQTCADCRTKDCIAGNPTQRGCELWLFQPRKVGNMDCTFCLDCVHACPHDNIGITSRLPAAELWRDDWRSSVGRFSQRPDIAALILVFTFGALLNAFGMISPIYALEQWLTQLLGTRIEAPALGLIFAVGLVVEPIVCVALASWLTRPALEQRESILHIANRYVYSLVPLGFGVWLAHYAFHFLSGFWTIVPVTQTILRDLDMPWFGAPRWSLGPLFPSAWIFPSQLGFIGLGCCGALLVAYQIAQRDAPKHALRAFLPWATLALLLTLAALWLMAQPMEMRGMIIGG